jgi:hypothetical protein
MRGVLAIAVWFAVAASVFASGQSDRNLEVNQYDGGNVALRTMNGFLNQDSSLKRTWYVIDNTNSPVRLDRAGIVPHLDEKEKIQYFVPIGTVFPRQAISALEVRYVLFNVWGERLRTLSLTRLADSSTHVDLRSGNDWPTLELEATQLVNVVTFVARVRMADGQVWAFNPEPMADRIESLGFSVSTQDLTADDQRIVNPALIYLMYALRKSDSTVKAGTGHPVD